MKITLTNLLRCSFLIFIFVGELSAYGVVNEKQFWKDYQSILDQVVVKKKYEGRYGGFFHYEVDYQKFKEVKALKISFKSQVAKLLNLTKVSDASQQLIEKGKLLAKKKINKSLSFWINVYNFHTLEQLFRRMEIHQVKSMKEIGWKKKEIKVSNKIYTLDEVEHKKIRPLKDARIHFAVNCASVSCPSLLDKVFLSSDIDKTLDDLCENSMKNPIHLRVESGLFGESLEATKLFDWYDEDWGSDEKMMEFLRKYMPKDYHRFDDFSTGISYDWNLNSAKYIKEHIHELKEDGYQF